MNDKDVTDLKLAVQRLDQKQEYGAKALDQMSNAVKELVTLQNDHHVLRAEIKASKEMNNNRISKIENSHVWIVRLVGAAVILKVLSLLWPIA